MQICVQKSASDSDSNALSFLGSRLSLRHLDNTNASTVNDGCTHQPTQLSTALNIPQLTPPADVRSYSDRLSWYLLHSSKKEHFLSADTRIEQGVEEVRVCLSMQMLRH